MVFATRHQYLNQYLNQIMGLRDRCYWNLFFLIFCIIAAVNSRVQNSNCFFHYLSQRTTHLGTFNEHLSC